MSESTEQVLEQAFALIENDQHLEAVALLKPVLAEDPDNVDAWWLYAHAVDDPETARMALNMVQKLDPDYPGADELLVSLEQEYPSTTAPAADEPVTPPEPEMRRVVPPPSLPNLPEDDDIDDFDELIFDETTDEPDFAETTTEVPVAEVQEKPRQNNWVIPALALVAILAVVLILLAILSQGGGDQPEPTQTSVAQLATLPVDNTQVTPDETEDAASEGDNPTADASALEVGAVPTTAVSSDTETAVTAALADFEVVADSIGATPTLLGNTLVTSVCSSGDGQERSDALNQIMYTLADTSTLVDSDIEAVGVRLMNCDSDRVYNVIAVLVSDAIAFYEGQLDERAYQATWRPVL